MNDDKLMDVRVPLAADDGVIVELGQGELIHVELDHVTLRLPREQCERITSAMARAMVRLRKIEQTRQPPRLRVVRGVDDEV